MPAQEAEKINWNIFTHIYNNGIEGKELFPDDSDFQTFLSFLKEYLTPPPKPEELKKSFSVGGRTFKGVPHQPKNYFGKVELVAYSLQPDHFHLLIGEVKNGSVEKLIRSLSTRYAIYYNKKYSRSGSLFSGPYKSVQLQNADELALLTRYFHRESLNANTRSSYEDYLGEKENSWVSSKAVLSLFNREGNALSEYKNFVESVELNEEQNKILENITIEKPKKTHEAPVSRSEKPDEKEISEIKNARSTPQPRPKVPEFVFTSIVLFFILSGLGVRNIQITSAHSDVSITDNNSPTPQVAGEESELELTITPSPVPTATVSEVVPTATLSATPSPTHIPKVQEFEIESTKSSTPSGTNKDSVGGVNSINSSKQNKSFVFISGPDELESINIHLEPSNSSKVVETAKNGETFNLVSVFTGWYRIELKDGTGYIEAKYAQIVEGEAN